MAQDWSPLAASDPIPGDPPRVADLARRLRRTSHVIRGQSTRLRGVKTGWWKGPAANEFVKQQEKLPPLLDDVVERYDQVGAALDQYYPTLQEAQDMAQEALRRAKVAEADIARARQGLEEMQQHALAESARVSTYNSANPDEPPATAAPWSGPDWGAALAEAEADMAAARQLLEDAKGVRDRGASSAAGTISNAIDDGLKNEGGMKGFVKRAWKGFTETVLPVLADIVQLAATVLAIASLIFPVLAPFALVFAAISLGLELLQVATGQGSWGDVAFAVIGLATFGVGRVLGSAARAGRGAAAAARAAATTRVAGGATARTGRTVYGTAARNTVKSQFNAVARHYRGATGLRSILPSSAEFRSAARALRTIRTGEVLKASRADHAAGLTGRLEPAIAGSVPHVRGLGDIAPKATRLARVAFGLDTGNTSLDVGRQVTAKPSVEEQAQNRADEVDATPVHP